MNYEFKYWTYRGIEIPCYDKHGKRFLAHVYQRETKNLPIYRVIDSDLVQERIKEGGFDLARQFIQQELDSKW